jgi:hypothetical protein
LDNSRAQLHGLLHEARIFFDFEAHGSAPRAKIGLADFARNGGGEFKGHGI